MKKMLNILMVIILAAPTVSSQTLRDTISFVNEMKQAWNISLLTGGGNAAKLNIRITGSGNCIDKGAPIIVTFTDGSRLELSSDENFNCRGFATVYLGEVFGKRRQLLELQTKKIGTIGIWTSGGFAKSSIDGNRRGHL